MQTETTEQWTNIIKPKAGWFDIDLKELWKYRDLIMIFVRRDFVSRYKQTILGPLWFLIQPLFTTIVFTIVFGNIARISTDGLPKIIFYLSGTVMWTYFAQCLNTTSNTFVANAGIFGKVYFPRLTVPISIVISNLINYGLQFAFFLCFLVYYMIQGADIQPNIAILLTPVLLLIMAALGLGIGIIVSSLTTKYRDLQFLVAFGVQLFMYATPVIYPLSTIPEKYKTVILLNPMTSIIEIFRYAYLGKGTFSWNHLGVSIIITFTILPIGMMMFSKVEKTFMDTV
ncbi:MAG: ABC transporter permease [Desulfobacteraceae bacterium]|nr:ABC transporter permease [Desulfobacteraceae bacterium]